MPPDHWSDNFAVWRFIVAVALSYGAISATAGFAWWQTLLLAAFALGEIRASDRLSVLLGTRLENNSYDADSRPEFGRNDNLEEKALEEGNTFTPPALRERKEIPSTGTRIDWPLEVASIT